MADESVPSRDGREGGRAVSTGGFELGKDTVQELDFARSADELIVIDLIGVDMISRGEQEGVVADFPQMHCCVL